MNVQVTHVIIHTPEQTHDIIRQALQITADTVSGGIDQDRIFEQACALLGARFSLALTPEPAPIALPRMAIPGGRH